MSKQYSLHFLRWYMLGALLLATGSFRYCPAQQQTPVRYTAASPDNPGPYNAGFRNVTLTRGTRTLACVLYYPAVSAGKDKPVDYSGRPYPMIAFGHGFGMQKSYYTSFYRHFASWGYIVIAPQFPDYQNKEMAYDLLYCLQYLRDQHGTTGSFLYASVDTAHPGLTGHSMGGGAGLLAASYDSRILAVAPMAAAETNPSAIAAMTGIQGAVCLVAASKDGITPPSTNQQPMYNAAHAFKSLPLFLGANHTRFMDYAGWDWTDPNGTMTRTEQQRLSRKYITAVFNLFLKRDPAYWTYVYGAKAKSEPKVSLSSETKYVPPFDFRLISPLRGTVTVSIDLLWHRALTLNPSDTVKYIIQISRNTVFSQIDFKAETFDTAATITPQIPDGDYYWRVIARNSPATETRSRNTGRFSWTVPVELRAFSARRAGPAVLLEWVTASEMNNYGFGVERAEGNGTFRDIGFVPGHGTTSGTSRYTFRDRASGMVRYLLRQVDFDGSSSYSPVITVDAHESPRVLVAPPYPNPVSVNRDAAIHMQLPRSGMVTIEAVGAAGRLIRRVFHDLLSAGSHVLRWNARDVPPGVYYIVVRSGARTWTYPVFVMK